VIFLVIIVMSGSVERVPMKTDQACAKAAAVINAPTQQRAAVAYCIKDGS
jgi:hypothetical protein